MGALPEDSSRGVGAVEVPEKRDAGRRYLGRLGGDLIVFSYPSTLSSSGRSRGPLFWVPVCALPYRIIFRAEFIEKVKNMNHYRITVGMRGSLISPFSGYFAAEVYGLLVSPRLTISIC